MHLTEWKKIVTNTKISLNHTSENTKGQLILSSYTAVQSVFQSLSYFSFSSSFSSSSSLSLPPVSCHLLPPCLLQSLIVSSHYPICFLLPLLSLAVSTRSLSPSLSSTTVPLLVVGRCTTVPSHTHSVVVFLAPVVSATVCLHLCCCCHC